MSNTLALKRQPAPPADDIAGEAEEAIGYLYPGKPDGSQRDYFEVIPSLSYDFGFLSGRGGLAVMGVRRRPCGGVAAQVALSMAENVVRDRQRALLISSHDGSPRRRAGRTARRHRTKAQEGVARPYPLLSKTSQTERWR